jgi:hypothetical protein
MSHRGVRSQRGKLKQAVRRYIFTTSFQDPILAESVCRVNREDLLAYASTFLVEMQLSDVPDLNIGVTVGDVPNVEKGLILSDSRGRGVFQK